MKLRISEAMEKLRDLEPHLLAQQEARLEFHHSRADDQVTVVLKFPYKAISTESLKGVTEEDGISG